MLDLPPKQFNHLFLHASFYFGKERERNDHWQKEWKIDHGEEKQLDLGSILKAEWLGLLMNRMCPVKGAKDEL